MRETAMPEPREPFDLSQLDSQARAPEPVQRPRLAPELKAALAEAREAAALERERYTAQALAKAEAERGEQEQRTTQLLAKIKEQAAAKQRDQAHVRRVSEMAALARTEAGKGILTRRLGVEAGQLNVRDLSYQDMLRVAQYLADDEAGGEDRMEAALMRKAREVMETSDGGTA